MKKNKNVYYTIEHISNLSGRGVSSHYDIQKHRKSKPTKYFPRGNEYRTTLSQHRTFNQAVKKYIKDFDFCKKAKRKPVKRRSSFKRKFFKRIMGI